DRAPSAGCKPGGLRPGGDAADDNRRTAGRENRGSGGRSRRKPGQDQCRQGLHDRWQERRGVRGNGANRHGDQVQDSSEGNGPDGLDDFDRRKGTEADRTARQSHRGAVAWFVTSPRRATTAPLLHYGGHYHFDDAPESVVGSDGPVAELAA